MILKTKESKAIKIVSINRSMEVLNWYAIYTMPRAEKKVFQRMITKEIDVYLPLVTTMRKWSDRTKKVSVPLISSFVFVKTQEKNLNKLYDIQGVCGILKHLRKPAIIKDSEIENLKILLNESEKGLVLSEVEFEEGEEVVVTKGPFKGLEATCVLVKDKYRLIVGISAIGNWVEINIPISLVEKKSN